MFKLYLVRCKFLYQLHFLFAFDKIFRNLFPQSVRFLSLSLGTLHFYRFARKSASLTSQRGVELYELAIASAATLRILTKILSATEEAPYRSAMLELLSSGRMIDTR